MRFLPAAQLLKKGRKEGNGHCEHGVIKISAALDPRVCWNYTMKPQSRFLRLVLGEQMVYNIMLKVSASVCKILILPCAHRLAFTNKQGCFSEGNTAAFPPFPGIGTQPATGPLLFRNHPPIPPGFLFLALHTVRSSYSLLEGSFRP